MPRPILATIHTAALRNNIQRIRAAAADSRVWAVVKANAYGHGIDRVFEGLRGADGFALLDLDEAARLRKLGWRGPIAFFGFLISGVMWLIMRWHENNCRKYPAEEAHLIEIAMHDGMHD